MVFMLYMWKFKGQTFIRDDEYWKKSSLTFKKHSIEVHIFDFDSDIYNEQIDVRFIKYMREESSFNNLDDFKNSVGTGQS